MPQASAARRQDERQWLRNARAARWLKYRPGEHGLPFSDAILMGPSKSD
jgi:hypothetical protein